ncbi:polysaccharide deacetylase [Bacillus solimangrovi]|uniref:Polysaccharide deacetylase n=2 Tax=Bacillus solimangrovi TaxID=1305675 RepID=A0A1E5LBG4_9BACI|nr:polysaccharide deacetylase [Bacillus solimangrovi]
MSPIVEAQESKLPEAAIYIDKQPINTRYIMRDDHLLVPALFLKNTGAQVDKNEKYNSIVFKMKNKLFSLPIGTNYLDDYNSWLDIWKRSTISTATVNFRGEIFVPLIDVATKLGMNVTYDSVNKTTLITTNYTIESNLVRNVNTTEKLVALTFDDGPEDKYTPEILDILKEKGVKATFYVVGQQIEKFPEQMRRIVNEGHGIGNHTWSHPDLKNKWSATVKEELLSTQDQIEKVVGLQSDLVRPPYGSYTKAETVLFNEIGLKNILWNVDTEDWSGNSADEILSNVRKDLAPGSIVLQHNFGGNFLDGTVEALPRIIDELHEEGYQFVTIHTLLDRAK